MIYKILDIIKILRVVHYILTYDIMMIDLYCPSQDKPTPHIILCNTLKAIAISLSQMPWVQDGFLTQHSEAQVAYQIIINNVQILSSRSKNTIKLSNQLTLKTTKHYY